MPLFAFVYKISNLCTRSNAKRCNGRCRMEDGRCVNLNSFNKSKLYTLLKTHINFKS